MILCDACGTGSSGEDITDCACGIPFCLDCFEAHCLECEEAREEMGINDLTDEEEEEDGDVCLP